MLTVPLAQPGCEQEIVFSLMHKSLDLEFSKCLLQILSAFGCDSLPGITHVGARSQKQVSEALMDSSASIPVVASLWCQSTKWPACLDVVTVNPVGMFDLEGQKVQVPARSVRKRFKPGDYVKVMSGKNADESDPVVSVSCPYTNGDGTMTYPTQSMSPAPDPNSSATPDPTSSLDGYAIQSSPLSSSPERFLEPTALGNIVTSCLICPCKK